MTTESIYSDPEAYDRMFPPGEHARFYREQAIECGGPVLELACGTGSLLEAIAEAGLEVAGLDLSPEMLEVARNRSAKAGLEVPLHESDMRDFDLGRRFRMVFVARNSLLHLLSIRDLQSAFAAIRRHLTTDGSFVFDIFNPSVEILARPDDQRFPVGAFTDSVGGDVTVEQVASYDSARQVNRCTWFYSAAGRPDFRTAELHVRCIYPQELPLLLESGGLELMERFGTLARDPFDASSPQQVCVCRVA